MTSHSAGAASTAVVHFTANGIQIGDHKGQTSVTIAPGSDVVFSNDIDPSQSVPVIGALSGTLRSVTVTVTGATQQQFTVERNQERVVPGYSSGSKPFVVNFSATYQGHALLGLATDPQSETFHGQITVAATPAKSTPPATSSSAPSPTQGKTSTPPPAQPTSKASSSAGPTSGSGSGGGQSSPTISGYTPPPSDVASQVMPPPGRGGSDHGGSGQTHGTGTTEPTPTASSTRPATHRSPRHTQEPVSTSSSSAAAGHKSDGPGGGNSNGGSKNHQAPPERALDTTASTSSAGSPLGANWSVIAAIALLSTVALALVRTLVTQRRTA